jgi:Flp pilus assembly protein TadG
MRRLSLLRSNTRGAAIIEFALAVPVLISLIWGMFQVGLLFQANAGIQHALGEAARQATIFPTPSDTQLQSYITSHKFGLYNGTWGEPTIDNSHIAKANGGYKVITVTYSQPTNFLFFRGPTVSITKSKTIYLSV